MLPNEKNLEKGEATRFRTGEEQAKIASAGGRASGASRRRKKQAAEYMRMLLEMEAENPELKRKLSGMGYTENDCTYGAALATAVLLRGVGGDMQAASLAYKIAAQAEAAEQAAKERREAKKRAGALQEGSLDDGFLEALAGAAQAAFPDDSDTLPAVDDTDGDMEEEA